MEGRGFDLTIFGYSVRSREVACLCKPRPSNPDLAPIWVVEARSTHVHPRDSLAELRFLRLRGDLSASGHIAVDH